MLVVQKLYMKGLVIINLFVRFCGLKFYKWVGNHYHHCFSCVIAQSLFDFKNEISHFYSLAIDILKLKFTTIIDTKLSLFKGLIVQKFATLNPLYVLEALQRKIDDPQ